MQGDAGTWQTTKANYIADMKAQLAELVTTYDPALLWFDGDWCADLANPTQSQWWNASDGQDLYDYLIGLKPDLIINERVKRDLGMGDYASAEFGLPGSPMERPWERCETMNGAWGYDRNRENSYYPANTMIQQLVMCVSRDGNYLLNIGPTDTGTVTQGSINILNEFADWMATYKDSIYGCIRSPFPSEPPFGCYTAKTGKLFAHIFSWPTSGHLVVPKLNNTITNVYDMSDPSTPLRYTVTGSIVDITLPDGAAPHSGDSVICIEVGGGMPMAATGTPIADGTYMITAVHSGKNIVVAGASQNDLAPVIQWPDTGGSEYDWMFSQLPNGFYSIINVNSGKAMDVNGAGLHDGARVIQWPHTGAINQEWSVYYMGDGKYALSPHHSTGKTMEIANASSADGTAAQQWSFSGQDHQLFYINSNGLIPPADPVGLAATPDDSKVSLSWSPASGATSYNVKRSTTSGSGYTTIAMGVISNFYTDSNVSPNTTYYYVISAVNSEGESANSSEVSAVVQHPNSSGPWEGAEMAQDSWLFLDWFGWFREQGNGWIYHLEHGYLYVVGQSPEALVLFDPELGCWMQTSLYLYPVIHLLADGGDWLYYFPGSGPHGQRIFFSYAFQTTMTENMLENMLQSSN